MINAIIQNKNGKTAVLDLTAHYYDEEGYYSSVSNYSILDNRGEIEDRLGIEQLPDLGDMAEYVGNHSGIGEKLIYAVWGLEKNGWKDIRKD